MSKKLDSIVDYTDLIESDQDTYYEIRDYLREALPLLLKDTVESYIQAIYGTPWSNFVDELIGDVRDLMEYESANSLSDTQAEDIEFIEE